MIENARKEGNISENIIELRNEKYFPCSQTHNGKIYFRKILYC